MTETRYQLEGDYLSGVGLTVEPTEMEQGMQDRLAAGTLVEDTVGVKRSWRFSYADLPGSDNDVKDGGLGRDSLRTLFLARGTLELTIPLEDGSDEEVDVMFGLQWTEKRRWVRPYWMWDVSFTLEEV